MLKITHNIAACLTVEREKFKGMETKPDHACHGTF